MYVICIMYFISATSNFMKFKLNLILNKTKQSKKQTNKKRDQQMQNGKKRTLEILDQAGLKQAFTVSSITVTDVTVQCYRCDTSFVNVKFLILVKKILNLFNKSFTC